MNEPLDGSPVEGEQALPVADSPPATVADKPADDAGADEWKGLPPEVQANINKRIGTLTKRNKEFEAQLQEREAALKERDARYEFLMAQMGNGREPPRPQNTDLRKPTREQYGTDEEFVAAYDRYAEQLASARSSELTQQQQEQAETQAFLSAEAKFAAEHPDYNQVVKDPQKVYFTPQVAGVLKKLENGAEIAYHLGKNPEMGWKIANLPPVRLVFELGAINAGIQNAKIPKKPLISAAPPPPPKVESEPEAVQKRPEEMSDKEYNEWSRKRAKNRK